MMHPPWLARSPDLAQEFERRDRWKIRFIAVFWLVINLQVMFEDESVRPRDGIITLCVATLVGLAAGLAANRWVPVPRLREPSEIGKRTIVLVFASVGVGAFALAAYLRLWTELLGLEIRPLRLFLCAISFAVWACALVRAPLMAQVRRKKFEADIAGRFPVPPRPDFRLA